MKRSAAPKSKSVKSRPVKAGSAKGASARGGSAKRASARGGFAEGRSAKSGSARGGFAEGRSAKGASSKGGSARSTSPSGESGKGASASGASTKRAPGTTGSPSKLIDARIKELGDWRGTMLSRLRALVKEADPEVVEEWKWRGVPVWEHAGIICTGETYKSVVKMTFAKGASLEDPAGLFNSSLEGNTRRAIVFHEGETINEEALKSLVRAAVSLNQSKAKR
jgi:hypothetical protein